jgi:DNA-binding IclR family transcriptional regulator
MSRKMAREPNTSAEGSPSSVPAAPSKISVVLDLLRREQGSTLAELVKATGWLPHTTRAALTGLRKKGHTIEKSTRDGGTVYRIAPAA